MAGLTGKISFKVDGSNKSTTLDKARVKDLGDVKFRPDDLTSDTYNIRNHVNFKLSTRECEEICTSTKELRKEVKDNAVGKRTMTTKDGKRDYFLVYKLKESNDVSVMSVNRFISICSATMVYQIHRIVYDWSIKKYVNKDGEIYKPDGINRLAETVGIPRESKLYWLYLPGCENCFEMYPIEVTAICSWRVLNPEKSKMRGEAIESLKSLSNKFSKKRVDLSELDTNQIVKYYVDLDHYTHKSRSLENAKVLYHKFEKLFSKVDSLV